ncbi:MAG: glycosyltransferase family 4 protein [Chloroflexi bacterium]|nr:glycosyltransferase family 4 protein [Chloroflexota bacterium]
MRICYIADAANIHTRKWVNYFALKGHEIRLISPRTGEGYSKNVRLYLLTTLLPQIQLISGYVNTLVWIVQTRRLMRKIKPDIIDAHYVTLYGYLGVASGFHPVILTAWGSDILITPKQSWIHRLLTRYALKKADMVICDSETMKRELLELSTDPTKIRLVYNGIDTQRFNPRRVQGFRSRAGIPDNVPVVISTRSLRPVYNVEMLIKAIPLVLREKPETRFLIIGDGEQKEQLSKLAGSLGVSNNIQFLGWAAHDDIPDYLSAADVYVSTSLSDSTSLSLQEAMACELAPVVTDLPANREWVKNGENGWLVPVNDVEAFANKIIHLLKNENLRKQFGKAGRTIIEQRAEYEKEMSKMEGLYRQMVKK